eukprot:TRINITY_DN93008_c0_g1_i1.p1 TRINITY_DN93008_c0_g1~~TRINITY_DN93008_c0_g1_i1.p1  ORF type:complete len:293 (-),score=40.04 TRINITY_DN93008_c0_g1_i1:341-1219(-)
MATVEWSLLRSKADLKEEIAAVDSSIARIAALLEQDTSGTGQWRSAQLEYLYAKNLTLHGSLAHIEKVLADNWQEEQRLRAEKDLDELRLRREAEQLTLRVKTDPFFAAWNEPSSQSECRLGTAARRYISSQLGGEECSGEDNPISKRRCLFCGKIGTGTEVTLAHLCNTKFASTVEKFGERGEFDPNSPRNFIPLCGTCHRAFDCCLVGIQYDPYQVQYTLIAPHYTRLLDGKDLTPVIQTWKAKPYRRVLAAHLKVVASNIPTAKEQLKVFYAAQAGDASNDGSQASDCD